MQTKGASDLFGFNFFSKNSKALFADSHAVVIGIDKYRKMPQLTCAVNDAKSIARLLPSLGFEKKNITTLYNSKASGEMIRHVLDDVLRDSTGNEDRVLVFFSGHGVDRPLRNNRKEGYICPVEGDPDRIGASCIRMREIRDWSEAICAKHMLFLMDCCYSGLALGAARRVAVSVPDYLFKVASKPCRHVITAGSAGELAVEIDGHGIFTRELIAGLQGAADLSERGYIKGEMLGSFLKERVADASHGKQNPISRQFDGEGEFIFLLSGVPPQCVMESKEKLEPDEDVIQEPLMHGEDDDFVIEDNEAISQCVRDSMQIENIDVRAGEFTDWEEFSESRSAKWLEGADLDSAEGQYLLGLWLLIQGENSDDGWKIGTGVEWLQKSANQKFSPAQALFGLCLMEGTGLEEHDEKLSIRMLKSAAEQDDGIGQFYLANFYSDGDGVRKNAKTAAKWYEKSAVNGYPGGMYFFGYVCLHGEGIEKDPEIGLEWIRKAAKKGHATAQWYLGNIYTEGTYVRKNKRAAFTWYRKAAEQGEPEAQFQTGRCLLEGEGTEANPDEAHQWLNIASDNDHEDARNLLNSL